MKRGVLYLGLAGLLLLCSCATVLPRPEKGTSALLVFPVQQEGMAEQGFAFAYEFGMAEIERKLYVHPNTKFTIISDLAPGTYTVDSITPVPSSGTRADSVIGKAQTYRFKGIPVVLKEGYITIMPVTLKVFSEMSNPSTITQRQQFILTKREAVIEELSEMENFESWKIAD